MTRKSILGWSTFAIVAVGGLLLWRAYSVSADRMNSLEQALDNELLKLEQGGDPDVLVRSLALIDSYATECERLFGLWVAKARKDDFLARARGATWRIASKLQIPAAPLPKETPKKRQRLHAKPTVL